MEALHSIKAECKDQGCCWCFAVSLSSLSQTFPLPTLTASPHVLFTIFNKQSLSKDQLYLTLHQCNQGKRKTFPNTQCPVRDGWCSALWVWNTDLNYNPSSVLYHNLLNTYASYTSSLQVHMPKSRDQFYSWGSKWFSDLLKISW